MANLQKITTGFEWGEISDRLLSRVDLPAYNKATKTMENFYAFIHGGATKRRGTLYIKELYDSDQAGRLIPFVFSNSSKFMLVMNGGKMEFIKDGATVESSPGTPYRINIPYSATELKNIRYSQSGNTMYLVHPNHFPKLLQRVSDTNWTLTDIPFVYNAVSDVTFANAFITFRIINGSNVFQEGEVFTITTTSGAITGIAGPTNGYSIKTAVTVATTGDNIALSGLLTVDGRVLIANDRVLVKDQTTAANNGIYEAKSGSWTRVADMNSAAECNDAYVQVIGGTVNGGSYWKQTANIVTLGTTAHVWEPATAVGNGQIAAVASMPGSNTTETWTIECTFSSASRQEWSVTGSVSGTTIAYWTTGNYPTAVSFFEQRLYFGGTPQYPQHIWGSAAGDYLNMTVGNQDRDAVIVQIAGNDYNAITHLVSARQLLPLTSSTEFSMAGPNNFAISGISSNVIKDHTSHGTNFVRPLKIGREVVVVQRDGRKVRAVSYSVTEDANIAPDLTLFAEHITRDGPIVDMTFAQNPDFIAWMVREDGQLLSLTLARDYDTTAWARHTTNGLFENVAAVPGSDSSDDVYLIVRRTISGVTKRFVEKFDYDDIDTAFMDCTSYYNGAPTDTISGLSHLNGKTVKVYADDVVHPDVVVSGGSITLQYEVEKALVGLGYTSTLELLNPEFGDAASSSQGRKISISDIIVRLKDTINLNVNGTVIPFRTNTMGLDEPIPMFTGDKSVKSLGWRTPNNVLITSNTPTPCTVLGVIIKAAVNE